MTLRSRTFYAASLRGNVRSGGKMVGVTTPFTGKETTNSTSNDLRGLGKWQTGGLFFNEKRTISIAPAQAKAYWGDELRYSGDVATVEQTDMANVYAGSWPVNILPSSDLVLGGMGATAIARSSPGSPSANVVVTLGELKRDGVPAIIGSGILKERTQTAMKRAARGSSSEYLNVEFGWKPLIADLRKTASSMKQANSLVKQYRRDSSRWVRRRYDFPGDSATSSVVYPPGSPAAYPTAAGRFSLDQYTRSPGMIATSRTTTERWFVGAFQQFVPPRGDDAMDRMLSYEADINHVLGTRLTPEAVWNLAPWSWAVDWFSNAGDVFHNVSEFMFDGLVMPYGYVMEKKTVTKTYTGYGSILGYAPSGQPQPVYPYECTVTMGYETKKRLAASPFGFATTWDSMSPRQLAIMAAIGINRGTTSYK